MNSALRSSTGTAAASGRSEDGRIKVGIFSSLASGFPYGATHRLHAIAGAPIDRTEEEQATLDALRAEFDRLQADYEDADELPDEVDERLGGIETAIDALETYPVRFNEEAETSAQPRLRVSVTLPRAALARASAGA